MLPVKTTDALLPVREVALFAMVESDDRINDIVVAFFLARNREERKQ
jgi:hypothetical protein